MKRALVLVTFFFSAVCLALGQADEQPQQVPASLDLVVAQVQKASQSANTNIARLRIERWKTDADQKDQLQKMADSIQRNITRALPSLIADVQSSHGSVVSTFKLYNNMTVVYEYLSSLTDAAGVLGKKEEYEPLAADAAALDAARENLSAVVEQSARQLEMKVQQATAALAAATAAPTPAAAHAPVPVRTPTPAHGTRKTGAAPGKKVVVDEASAEKRVSTDPKKVPRPAPSPSPK